MFSVYFFVFSVYSFVFSVYSFCISTYSIHKKCIPLPQQLLYFLFPILIDRNAGARVVEEQVALRLSIASVSVGAHTALEQAGLRVVIA